jgi:hypothetical protein
MACAALLIAAPLAFVLSGGPDGGSSSDSDGVFTGGTDGGTGRRGAAGLSTDASRSPVDDATGILGEIADKTVGAVTGLLGGADPAPDTASDGPG